MWAAVLIALTFVDAGMLHAPMLSFVVAISLCAVRFGLPGGVASGLVGVAIAGVWFLHGHYGGGIVGFAWQSSAFLFVGCLVGGAVSDRRELERIVTQHAALTLDLICHGHLRRLLHPGSTQRGTTLGYGTERARGPRPFLDFIHPGRSRGPRLPRLGASDGPRRGGAVNFQQPLTATRTVPTAALNGTSRPDPRARPCCLRSHGTSPSGWEARTGDRASTRETLEQRRSARSHRRVGGRRGSRLSPPVRLWPPSIAMMRHSEHTERVGCMPPP